MAGAAPGEHSTGGKQKLTDTSRRGNKYLRKLFVQGAHTVLLQRTKQAPGLSLWLANLVSRKRTQVATVALANKMARIAWAVLTNGEPYRPPLAAHDWEILATDSYRNVAFQRCVTWKIKRPVQP